MKKIIVILSCLLIPLNVYAYVMNPTDFYELTGVVSVYVIDSDCYIYSGPALYYEKASEDAIPVGTTLTYHYVSSYSATSTGAWGYVTYNGVSGWILLISPTNIETYGTVYPSVAKKSGEDILILSQVTSLLSTPLGTDTLTVNIEANTEIEAQYSYTVYTGDKYDETAEYNFTTYYYITYNGVSGWLKKDDEYTKQSSGYELISSNIASPIDDCYYMLNTEKEVVYSSPSKASITSYYLPSYSETNYLYYFPYDGEYWYGFEYQGAYYYIIANDTIATSNTVTYYTSSFSTKLFESYSHSSDVVTTIAGKETLVAKYTMYDAAEDVYFYYYDSDGTQGWFTASSSKIETSNDSLCNINTSTVNIKEDTYETDGTLSSIIAASSDTTNSVSYIKYIVIGACALVVVGVLVVVLKSRKK